MSISGIGAAGYPAAGYSNEGMHGVGLMNVKAVVDKYGGDFAVSCSQGKYQAVVMI